MPKDQLLAQLRKFAEPIPIAPRPPLIERAELVAKIELLLEIMEIINSPIRRE